MLQKEISQNDCMATHKYFNLPFNLEVDASKCLYLQFSNESKLPDVINKNLSPYKNFVFFFTHKSELIFSGLETFLDRMSKVKKRIHYLEINLKNLEKWHKMDESEVQKVCSIFATRLTSKVDHLYLYFDSICETPSEAIIQSIISIPAAQTQLLSLHIELSQMGQKGVGKEGCIALCDLLTKMTQLKHLSLNLHKYFSDLERLKKHQNQCVFNNILTSWGTENGFEHPNQNDLLRVIQTIPSITTLTSLSLAVGGWQSWRGIRDTDVDQYMKELSKLPPLQSLQLDFRGWGCTISNPWDNRFTDESSTYISSFLSTQQSLTHLSLILKGWGDSNQFFTSRSIETFGRAIEKLSNLEFLYVDLAKPPSSRDFVCHYSPYSVAYLISNVKSLIKLQQVNFKLPNTCMIPKVKKILALAQGQVKTRSLAVGVLKALEISGVNKNFRQEIIHKIAFQILNNPLAYD